MSERLDTELLTPVCPEEGVHLFDETFDETIANENRTVAFAKNITEHEEKEVQPVQSPQEISRLVEENIGLVGYVIGRMTMMGYDRNLVVSGGHYGLFDAARRFDPSLGFTFSTFAVTRIRGAILDDMRSNYGLHRATNVPLEPSHRKDTVYLDDPESRHHISQEVDLGPEALVLDRIEADEETTKILKLAAVLAPEQREVILGKVAGMNLAQMGEQMGVSEARASQLYSAAIAAMRMEAGVLARELPSISPYLVVEHIQGMKSRATEDECVLSLVDRLKVAPDMVLDALDVLESEGLLHIGEKGRLRIVEGEDAPGASLPLPQRLELDHASRGLTVFESAVMRNCSSSHSSRSRRAAVKSLQAKNEAHAVSKAILEDVLLTAASAGISRLPSHLLRLIEMSAAGAEPKEIAASESVSPTQITSMLAEAQSRAGARSIAHAVRLAYESGQLSAAG